MLKRPTPTPLRWMAATFLALGLSASAGYAAWAAQPASVPGLAKEAASGLFLLARQNSYDGIAGGGTLSQWVKAGDEAVSIVGSGDAQWKSTAVVEAGTEPGAALVRMRIEHGQPGEVVAEPVLMVKHGEPGAVEQREASGKVVYRSQFMVLPLTGSRESTEQRMRDLLLASDVGAPEEVRSKKDGDGGAWDQLKPVGSPIPPKYPVEAARSVVAGKVVLLLDIVEGGHVTGVQVEEATPPGVFDANTVAAAWQWRFEPELRDGRPVAGRQRVPVTFSLGYPDVEAGHAQ
jgi:TonB family protein